MFAAVNRRRRGDRYPVAITFDDDLRTHISIALPVLERTGISATFFLTGASLRGPYSFWWERLARVPKENLREAVSTLQLGIPERFELEELGAAMKQLEPEIRENVEMRLAQVAGPDPPDAGIRAQDVRTLVEARMEIGFHTLLHHNLRLLTARLLAGAMQHGRAELEEVVGEPLRVICYPYGEADERVAIAAKEAGFLIGFTAESRTVTPADDPLLCGRVSPTHGSVGGLAARIVVTLLRRR
jgi:peptidoglycan/xylan/chitin deacetylase (PgdA/CDA1 family)